MRHLLLAALLAGSFAALAQPIDIDYRLGISQGGIAVPGGEVVYAPFVEADWWTTDLGSFEVRMTVPAGVETSGACTGELKFDAATRVLTWTDRLDNEYIAFKSCPLTFRVDPAARPGATFHFTATLTTSKPDRSSSNNTATLTSVVLPSSDLTVAGSSDIKRFRAGAIITYTFAITNHGPNDAHDVSFTDYTSPWVDFISLEQTGGPAASLDTFLRETPRDCAMPPPCNFYLEGRFPILPSGATATFKLVVRAKPSVEAADIVNRIVVRSTSFEPTERNNEAYVVTFAGPEADLVLWATRLPSPSEHEIPIAMEITNHGPDTVNHVTVHQALAGGYDVVEGLKFASVTTSQGTCSTPELIDRFGSPPPPPTWELDCALGALAPGGKATITVLLEKAPGVKPFEHFAAVAPAQNDARPENNVSRIEVGAPGGRRRAVRR